MKRIMFNTNAILLAIAALPILVVHGHISEVRSCLTFSGTMRFYLEHWGSELSDVSGVGDINVIQNHISGNPMITVAPSGYFNNIAVGNLPGCANQQAPELISTCNQVHNNWVYYDLPAPCNTEVEYALSGPSIGAIFLNEACTPGTIYPAAAPPTTKTDATPPTLTVDGQQCNGHTIRKVITNCEPSVVNFNIATVDDCDVSPTIDSISNPSGSTFPVGQTLVTVIASDDTGKTSQCLFTVDVVQNPDLIAECQNTAPPIGVLGDPHFVTFSGEKYDFHGVCDLVLLRNPTFHDGLGMHIHLRTKRTRMWSFVDVAVIMIGEDVLEVTGGQGKGHGGAQYWINHVPQITTTSQEEEEEMKNNIAETTTSSSSSAAAGITEVRMMKMASHFPLIYHKISVKTSKWTIDLGSDVGSIVLSTWNSYVRVDVRVAASSTNLHNNHNHSFDGSIGLLGSYSNNGARVGRDGRTVINDNELFGLEWQANYSRSSSSNHNNNNNPNNDDDNNMYDPMLFHTDSPVQGRCEIPSASEMRRRLRISNQITKEQAKLACSSKGDKAKDDNSIMEFCIFDVMASNNMDVAGMY